MTPAPTQVGPFDNPYAAYKSLTLQRYGWLPGALGRTAAFAGAGALAGAVADHFSDDDRKTKRYAMLGALLSTPATALDIAAQTNLGWGPVNTKLAYTSPWDTQGGTVDTQMAAATLLTDPHMAPEQKAVAFDILTHASNDGERNRLTIGDFARGAIGAGVGALAGTMLGSVLALAPDSQKFLSRAGAIAGGLRGLGVL